jgi:hypothetical protein
MIKIDALGKRDMGRGQAGYGKDFHKTKFASDFRQEFNLSYTKRCIKCYGHVTNKTVDWCKEHNKPIVCWKCNQPV